jgi:hypothetical protein
VGGSALERIYIQHANSRRYTTVFHHQALVGEEFQAGIVIQVSWISSTISSGPRGESTESGGKWRYYSSCG